MFAGWRFRRAVANLEQAGLPILQRYAGSTWPDRKDPVSQVDFLALDFELDGLGASAHILQAGWVHFTAAAIPLADAQSRDIRSTQIRDDVAVTIHGIGEQRAREGAPLEAVLEELLPTIAGRVIVAHGASIEAGVIKRATRAVLGQAVPVRTICTLALERKLRPQLPGAEPYRLHRCRARYNLPPYAMHDALEDALAAAELFLAQLSCMPADTSTGELEDLAIHH
ncbi:exonuclease domain-containing protein [Parerythrobacter jejuensis]|uniref:3'-5' exonuclease n=1 Tax=Parerythrobacter jejuensis TaxID=795812 RepID=A0A845AS39_9SPHN|nr:exonuclease domain-containing protein [Parerythrobacter jejuensis]MXP31326.1 3'-5' exonuclease [Parerythrobacter jejuensis]MXP34086.1 3'-5' exonuclease [Parerythrobacter jejuensis]